MRQRRTTLDEWVLERYVTKGFSLKEFLSKNGSPKAAELARKLHLIDPQPLRFWAARGSVPWAVYLALLSIYGEPKHHRPPQRIIGERAARLPLWFTQYVDDGEIRRRKPGGVGSVRVTQEQLDAERLARQTPAPRSILAQAQLPEPEATPTPPPPASVDVVQVPSLGTLTIRLEVVMPDVPVPQSSVPALHGALPDKEQAYLKRIKELELQVSTLRAASQAAHDMASPTGRIHVVAREHPELARSLAGATRR